MRKFRESAISNLELAENSYVYSVNSTAARPDSKYDYNNALGKSDCLFISTSDDSLIALDPETLQILPGGHFRSVNSSLTVAKPYATLGNPAETIVTTGRDGLVVGWDLRSQKQAFRLVAPGGANDAISALECHADSFTIAAGTELEGNGPGDVTIYVWDVRQPHGTKQAYRESHTDTITELRFLPFSSTVSTGMLLSGSTDGLVNVFDLGISDEDDAVLQVINHHTAIHHTGLVGDDIYALGTDEQLSFYARQNPDPNHPEPEPCIVGDVRQALQCDYAMKLRNHPDTPLMAVGNHMDWQGVHLVSLTKTNSSLAAIRWAFNTSMTIQLDGAHGEELVRDYYVDDASQVIFTCGEDGTVRQWRGDVIEEELSGNSRMKKSRGG